MKIVNVNIVGTLNVTTTIFPMLAARKKGHVVNISSILVRSKTKIHVEFFDPAPASWI